MEEPLIRTLEEQIAEKIKNYRKGTGVYDAEHVDRWISQFPEEERMVVLTETNRLLEQNYVDQAKLFFVKHFSLKKASEFPVFSEGFSLL